MGKVDAGGVARLGIVVEREGLADLEFLRAVAERADAQLRPLQIGEDADRPPNLLLDCRGCAPTSVRISAWSVWLMLIRKTSAPASNSLRIIASSEEAGPSVARILTFRLRLIWSPFQRRRPRRSWRDRR